MSALETLVGRHTLLTTSPLPVGPFVAFASPYDPIYVQSKGGPTPSSKDVEAGRKAFEKAIKYFKKESVQLVVRLNEDTYDREDVTSADIAHEDMVRTLRFLEIDSY